jgi:histidinol-phosphate aminotransferase
VFDLNRLLRENIKRVRPYASARDEYEGSEGIFLDANENAIGSATNTKTLYNRYPDPRQKALKEKIASLKRVTPSNVFLGNGSDEAIDLLFRAVCNPGKDNVLIMPPTYGMYEVSAGINDAAIKEVPLTPDFMIDTNAVLGAVDEKTKIVFICSPNNPTGNALRQSDIRAIIEGFAGIVVVDEAYIDFAPDKSFLHQLDKYPNLVVMQTFSKAWGMASLRLGMAFASEEIIKVLTKIKPPYNINGATQSLVLEGLDHLLLKEKMVEEILDEREKLMKALKALPVVNKVYPSDANFVLVKFKDGRKVYEYLVNNKVITRDRSKVKHCEESIRISIGLPEENAKLLEALEKY